MREITLLGQNVNAYGRDLRPERRSFSELLRAVDAVPGISRIRYTSPHPKDMREDVVRAHAELPALCEHIHLPLQSGSSRVLKAMRRTYDRERYLDRVAMIRELVPDCALTTDVIVGFPGESEQDFEQTLEVVDQVGYDSAFTFVFSPRRGTTAATITEGLVPPEVMSERMERLVELVQRRARERAQRYVGRTLEVLVEGTSRNDPARLRGRSRHNKVVNFSGLAQPGELVDVDDLRRHEPDAERRDVAAGARAGLSRRRAPRGYFARAVVGREPLGDLTLAKPERHPCGARGRELAELDADAHRHRGDVDLAAIALDRADHGRGDVVRRAGADVAGQLDVRVVEHPGVADEPGEDDADADAAPLEVLAQRLPEAAQPELRGRVERSRRRDLPGDRRDVARGARCRARVIRGRSACVSRIGAPRFTSSARSISSTS